MMSAEDAKTTCASMLDCKGFTFEGSPDGPTMILFKSAWNTTTSRAGMAYRMMQPQKFTNYDVCIFMFCSMLGLVVAVLLATLLTSHIPSALENLTTIERNYERKFNPYDRGSGCANLATTMGAFGLDWFLPVDPWRPTTDGIAYPPIDGDDFGNGNMEHLPPVAPMQPNAPTETLWRRRYQVRPPDFEMKHPRDGGPLAWLNACT